MLASKEQTHYSLFSLFISFNLLQIIANHTNLKADRGRVQVTKHQRQWYPTNLSEIGAFLGILLYMGYTPMPRIRDFWNVNPKLAIRSIILKSMSRTRWEHIRRYLKISNPIEDEKVNTRGPDWWKKLEPLITEFRVNSQRYWTPSSHVSVDEQLIMFKGRSCHTIQIATKAAGVGFIMYSLCQENYLFDFLLTSKV